MNPHPDGESKTTIALRQGRSVVIGSANWMHRHQIEFKAALMAPLDSLVEIQLELTGRSTTVYGLGQIQQQIPSREERVLEHTVALVRMVPEDLHRLNDWFSAQTTPPPANASTHRSPLSLVSIREVQDPKIEQLNRSTLQRYEREKQHIQADTNLLQAPFALRQDGTTRPSAQSASPTLNPGTTSSSAGASNYLEAMKKRRSARGERAPGGSLPSPQPPRSTPTGPSTPPRSMPTPKNEQWDLPPPPPAALKAASKPPRDEEEWDLPPPPLAALKTASKPPRDEEEWDLPPPPPAALKTQAQKPTLHASNPSTQEPLEEGICHAHCVRAGSTLELSWSNRDIYAEDMPHLLGGSLRVPVQTEPVRSLTLNLPGGAKLALRIKNQVDGANWSQLDFRINLVLQQKLKDARNA